MDRVGQVRERNDQRGGIEQDDGRAWEPIGAGALVWSEVIGRVQAEVERDGRALTHVVTSEHDILDGIAWSLAD